MILQLIGYHINFIDEIAKSIYVVEQKYNKRNKDYLNDKEILLNEIEVELKETSYTTGVSRLSLKVRNALKKVPRELFVPLKEKSYAYLNNALPIGEGQTISQPFIVALMTELIDVQATDKVLEIGTGSGYQAAILSLLASQVYTVEIFPSLAKQAQKRFKQLNCKKIYSLVGDGNKGWVEHAPYDKIIVTAAAQDLPYALIDQLSANGIMVIPLGEKREEQYLTVIKKDAKGNLSQTSVLPVLFVPFIHK